MNKIYFENVPNIGSLRLEETLFSFEGTPILFVCIDKDNIRYFCLCDDIIDEESWIIVQISNETLLKVLNDEITVLNAFKNKNILIANKSFNKTIKYTIEEYNKIDPDELPVSDQYLEMREYLSNYINRISCSSFTDSLFPSDLACKYSFLQYILNINISYSYLQQENTDINDQLIKEAPKLNKDFPFKIKVEEDKSIEPKEWLVNATIQYAA